MLNTVGNRENNINTNKQVAQRGAKLLSMKKFCKNLKSYLKISLLACVAE